MSSEPKTTWRVEHWYWRMNRWMDFGKVFFAIDHAREYSDCASKLFGRKRIIRIETREFVEEEK